MAVIKTNVDSTVHHVKKAHQASGPMKKDYLPIQIANSVVPEHGVLALVIRRRVQIYARQASGPTKRGYPLIRSANYAVLENGAVIRALHQTPTVHRVTKAAFLPLVKGKHRVLFVTTNVRQEPIQMKRQFLLNRNARLV
jgi:hypothetical protein